MLLLPALALSLLAYQHLEQKQAPQRPSGGVLPVSWDPPEHRLAVQRTLLGRAAEAKRLAALGRVGPQRLREGPGLILAPRPRPYGPDELVGFGANVARMVGDRLELRVPVYVPRGATLQISAPAVRTVRLVSSPQVVASVVGIGGTSCSPGTPLPGCA